jgi:hypothetical protein
MSDANSDRDFLEDYLCSNGIGSPNVHEYIYDVVRQLNHPIRWYVLVNGALRHAFYESDWEAVKRLRESPEADLKVLRDIISDPFKSTVIKEFINKGSSPSLDKLLNERYEQARKRLPP